MRRTAATDKNSPPLTQMMAKKERSIPEECVLQLSGLTEMHQGTFTAIGRGFSLIINCRYRSSNPIQKIMVTIFKVSVFTEAHEHGCLPADNVLLMFPNALLFGINRSFWS